MVTKYIYSIIHINWIDVYRNCYHFVRDILSVPFCPIPFCPVTNRGQDLLMRILPSLFSESANQHLPTRFLSVSLFCYVALFICRSFKQVIFCCSFETVPDLSLFRYVALSILTHPSCWNDLPQQLRLELLTLPLPLSWKRLKTILFASDSTDLSRERLWISEWLYINVQIQLQ